MFIKLDRIKIIYELNEQPKIQKIPICINSENIETISIGRVHNKQCYKIRFNSGNEILVDDIEHNLTILGINQNDKDLPM